MEISLPKGWTKMRLGDVCTKPQYGWTCSSASHGRLRYLRTTDISKGEIDWDTVPFCSDEPTDQEKYLVQSNDILVSRAGSVGISYRIDHIPKPTVFASYLIRFRALACVDPRFVEYFLRSPRYWDAIAEHSAGIAVPNVNASKLAQIEIPIPPIAEQRRIVARLQELLGKVDACQKRLDRIPNLMKRFRQAVLQAACEGKLTEDNDDGSWLTTTVGELISEMRTGPFGSALHKSDYVTGGVSVINPTNLINGQIIPSTSVSVNKRTFARLADYVLLENDIVVARRGEMGRCALVTAQHAGSICGTGCAILRFAEKALPRFMEIVISSPTVRAYLVDASVGTTMDNLNQRALKGMPLRLPGKHVQRNLVKRTRELLSWADTIEKRHAAVRVRTDGLAQSILAKAFRGELTT